MAFPSMRKILREQFGMEAITTRYEVRRNGKTLELDIFAYSNGTEQKAIIVEVKSHLRAVVDAQDSLKAQVLNNGLYYAEIHHDVFALKVPLGFQAQVF